MLKMHRRKDTNMNVSFEFSMREAMLNHYLTTGKMLPREEAKEAR